VGTSRKSSTPALSSVGRGPSGLYGLPAAAIKIECGVAAMELGRGAYRSERTHRDARFAGADYYYAAFQVARRSVLTQNDEVAQLAVGDVALLDAARPAACFADDSQWLRLQTAAPVADFPSGFEPQGGLYARAATPRCTAALRPCSGCLQR